MVARKLRRGCGGDGICGRCKMIVKKGKIHGDGAGLLTHEEIRKGVVLACQSYVRGDLKVEIPEADYPHLATLDDAVTYLAART